MSFDDVAGWLAAAFTLASFGMRRMIPLRAFAVMANLSFIAYTAPNGVGPVLLLHLALLPLNLLRLVQMVRLVQRTARSAEGSFSLLSMQPYMRSRDLADGQLIFAKGDASHAMYVVVSGQVRLLEIAKDVGPGEVLGEIGMLALDKRRTLTAICVGPCRIATIDEPGFRQLYFQNPEFGLQLVHLVARRLMDDVRRIEARSRPEPASVQQ